MKSLAFSTYSILMQSPMRSVATTPMSIWGVKCLGMVALLMLFFVSSAHATQVPDPTLSVPGGTYTSTQTVTVNESLSGATIYYTLDGSTPTTSSSTITSGSSLTISTTTTLKVQAYATHVTPSNVITAVYTILPTVADPTLTVAGGTYSTAQMVTISDSTSGAAIYYTLDGTPPTTSSSSIASGSSVTISTTATLKVQAFKAGWTSSNVVTANYIIGSTATLVPIQLRSLYGILGLANGDSHTLAFKNDGTVWSWGSNSSGQLGNDSTASSSTPVQASIINNAVGVAAGTGFSLGLGSDGNVWTWGGNGRGQLGVSSSLAIRNVPAIVTGLSNAVQVSAGAANSVALKNDGTVWGWGAGTEGELGNGSNSDSFVPVTVSSLSGVVQVVAGNRHLVSLKSDGSVWSWGSNSNGQLGNNSTTNSNTPVQVTSLSGIVQIGAGVNFSMALKSDGTIWAWGANPDGELGNGTTTQSLIPVQVSTLTGIVAIATAAGSTYALKGDGTLWTWGLNANGQLGNGSTTSSSTAVQVTGFTTSTSGITGLVNGSSSNHSVVLTGNSTIYAWGDNASGDLGDGSTTQRTSPVLAAAVSSSPPSVAPTITLTEPDGATLLP